MSNTDAPDDWPARFAQERARWWAALGATTAGGLIEDLEHIGATSVPGLPAAPGVDIRLAAPGEALVSE